MLFPTYLKLSNDTLPSNTDLHVHIIYFNSWKIFKFLGRFIIGARMHIRPWAHWWLDRALIRRCWQVWVNNDRYQGQNVSVQLRVTEEEEDRTIVRATVTVLDSSLQISIINVQYDPWHISKRDEFMLSSTYLTLTSHACTPLSPIKVLPYRSTRNWADWRRKDETRFQM